MSTARSGRSAHLVPALVAGTIALVVAFPLYWVLNTALTSPATLYTRPQSLLPDFSNLAGLKAGLARIPLGSMLLNSAFVATGTAVISVGLGLCTAYALSRLRFRGKGLVAFALFATQMVPEGVFLIPIYAIFLALGLINSLWGLVLVNVAFALPAATFIIKTGIDQVPYEIEEAARVDNCPRLAILPTIVVPLVMPSIAAAAVLSFFSAWGELMYASTFITTPSKWPASVQLSALVASPVANIPVIMGVSVLYSAPAVLFFLIVQRRVVSGLTSGAVKG